MNRVEIISVGTLCLLILGNAEAAREQCALLKATQSEVVRARDAAYIELGSLDVGNDFSLEMQVQASSSQINGNLFAVGSQREFPYYAYAGWFHAVQFLILEVTHSSVTLTLKARGDRYSDTLSVSHVYPSAYELDDGNFHRITVRRTPTEWVLGVDGTENSRSVSDFNIQLQDKDAFLGGRPGYLTYQFRGIIKNVRVNGAPLELRGLDGNEQAQITRCGSRGYNRFVDLLNRDRADEDTYVNSLYEEDDDEDVSSDSSSDSEGTFFDFYDRQREQQNNYAVLPGIFRRALLKSQQMETGQK